MKKIIIALCILFKLANAQSKEGSVWFFGRNAGLEWVSSGNPTGTNFYNFFDFSQYAYNTVSDSTGKVIFQTQSGYLFGNYIDFLINFLPKNPTLTYSMPLKSVEDRKIYYLINLSADNNLLFQKVNTQISPFTITSGIGINLLNNQVNRKMALIRKSSSSYHLITKSRNNDIFNIHKIDSLGIEFLTHLIIKGSFVDTSDNYIMKSSPNSQYLAFGLSNSNDVTIVELNTITSLIDKKASIKNATDNGYLTFSPNSKFLYINHRDSIFQFDISSMDSVAILNSKTLIGNSGCFPYLNCSKSLWDMQIAIDGKIYITSNNPLVLSSTPFMSVINNPDQIGSLTGFSLFSTIASSPVSPWIITTGIDLPVQNQTIFRNAGILQATANSQLLCIGSKTNISAYGGGVSKINWEPSLGLNTTSGFNVIASPTTTTTYSITGFNEFDTLRTTITIQVSTQSPSISGVNISTQNICQGGIMYLNSTVNSTNFTIYNWETSSKGIFSKTDKTNTKFIFDNDASSGLAVFTFTAFNGCTDNFISTVNLNLKNQLILNGGLDKELCYPNSVTSVGLSTITSNFFPSSSNIFNWQPSQYFDFPNRNLTSFYNFSQFKDSTFNKKIVLKTENTLTGCLSIDTVVIYNYETLKTMTSKKLVCPSDTSRISAFGAGADIFSWSPAAGLNTTTGANVIATPTVTTTYTVSGTGACNNSLATVRIDVLPKVNIVSTFTGLPVCAGGQVQLLATITGASAFSWGTLAGLGIQTNTSVSSSTLFTSVDYRTPTSINATQVILSASNAACFAKDTLKIPLLSAIQNLSFAGNNLSFCSSLKAFGGNTTLVSALFPVSQNRYTWQQLNGNNNGISILESNSIPTTFSGMYVSTTTSVRTADFSLAVSNTLSGCTSLDTMQVGIFSQPILPTITGRSSLCPEVQNMPYALLAPLPLQSVYSWSVSGGSLALPTSLPSAIVNWSATPQIGTIAVQSVFTTSGCSSNIAFFTTTINPTINTQTPQGSGENIFCTLQNTSQVFSVPTFAGSVFNWNMRYQPDGLSNISSFVKTSTGVFGNFNQNFSASGIYLIQVQEIVNTASSRCVATSDVLTITAFASPKPNQQLILPDSICGNAQLLTASLTGFVGSVYDWSISGGLASTLSGIDLNQITLTFTGLTNPLILSVQETTFNNCKGNTISKTIGLFPVPKPSIVTGSTQFCGQLPPRSLYIINGNAASTYQWKLDDLLAYTSTGTTFDFPFVNVPIKEKYIVSVTETSKNGCVGTKNELPIQLDIINLSLVGTSFFDDSDNKIRIDFTLQSLINRSIETFYTRVLGNTSFKSNSSIVDSPALDTLFLLSNADLKYTVFSKNLCGDTLNTQTHQPIFLKASVDTSVGTVILQWNAYKINKTKISQSYVVWQRNINQPWNELTAVSDSSAILEVAKLGEFQQFKVSTQIGNYLSFSNTSPVLRFNSNIKIYTAFTPNEDGKNDTWVIERLNLYPSNELLITDKFSNIVFRAKPYLNNWNASEMPEGLYYYILYLNNNSKPIIGTVNVIR